MKHAFVLTLLAAAMGGCGGTSPDPERVEYHFKACMKQAEKASLLARVNSPVDECEGYAYRQAHLEARQ